MLKVPARSQQYVRIKDELTWNEFGAPDPGFFDRWIKDNLLEVIEQQGEYLIVLDPTDPEGIFSVHNSWVAKQDQINQKVAS